VTFGPGKVDAWVVGSGWDDQESTQLHWERAIASGVGVVVDAGGLTYIDGVCSTQCLLTPHAGELARLLGVERSVVEKHPSLSALEAAQRHGCTVLLKGHQQFVAHHDGTVVQLQSGSPGLARAGSGDVLAGIAGTLIAQTGDLKLSGLLAAGFQAWVSTKYVGTYPPDRMAEFMAGHIPGLDLP
jgi:NAD(P)H-hydrate repair Nnr-like enzyme with NAD(P)H-hydrate dehydratase domain